MQDLVIEEIVTRVKGKNIMIDMIFKKDDPHNNGYVPQLTFYTILAREL